MKRLNLVNIVHIGPAVLPVTYSRGGAIQRRMLEIAKLQAARGHKVILYSASDETRRVDYHGVEICSLACRGHGYFRDLEFQRKAVRDLLGQRVEVLHFHSLPEGAAFSPEIACKKLLSYDYFAFRRGNKTPLFWWYQEALRKFSYLLPVSNHCWQGSRNYWGLGGIPTQVLHNGVNLDQFCPCPARGQAKRQALGINAERVILYVGRVCEQKGTDILIEAYLRIKQAHASTRLVVVGPADMFGRSGQNELTRRISECGGLYLGAVEEAELAAIYNMADVFVMPTREIEMFGMAAIEAQACGKPVVASRHGGLPEVISEQSGLFFQTGDAGSLAEQLSFLLENAEFYRSLAAVARENATRFAWARIVDQLEDIYSQS
jgi:glycosyltransferase involved in cell wall biosynthesis